MITEKGDVGKVGSGGGKLLRRHISFRSTTIVRKHENTQRLAIGVSVQAPSHRNNECENFIRSENGARSGNDDRKYLSRT